MSCVTEKIVISGMHCKSCELLIEERALGIDGVFGLDVDYTSEVMEITFDTEKTTIEEIFKEIEGKEYVCSLLGEGDEREGGGIKRYMKLSGILLGIAGLTIVGYFLFALSGRIVPPDISRNMGYGLLFVVGLLTGFHCVGMCGGFVVSYTAKGVSEGLSTHVSHLKYGLGKTISYTVIGAGFGLLGSIIAFTPMLRGVAGIFAGLFLVFFGLNMLGMLPWLKRFRISAPYFLQRFVRDKEKRGGSSLTIGLLNGLMIACGPLQAIYIMAAGTGSVREGAVLLFVFALGTLPVMLGFGFITSFISNRATVNILKVSGAIVIILGFVMINRGLALTGTGFDVASLTTTASVMEDDTTFDFVPVVDGYQIINMDITRYGWEPDSFTLKKGLPVKWIINGVEITRCNNAIQVPTLGLSFDIVPGEQVIEFTPEESGVISWSCWMGMIPGTFVIKEEM